MTGDRHEGVQLQPQSTFAICESGCRGGEESLWTAACKERPFAVSPKPDAPPRDAVGSSLYATSLRPRKGM